MRHPEMRRSLKRGNEITSWPRPYSVSRGQRRSSAVSCPSPPEPKRIRRWPAAPGKLLGIGLRGPRHVDAVPFLSIAAKRHFYVAVLHLLGLCSCLPQHLAQLPPRSRLCMEVSARLRRHGPDLVPVCGGPCFWTRRTCSPMLGACWRFTGGPPVWTPLRLGERSFLAGHCSQPIGSALLQSSRCGCCSQLGWRRQGSCWYIGPR